MEDGPRRRARGAAAARRADLVLPLPLDAAGARWPRDCARSRSTSSASGVPTSRRRSRTTATPGTSSGCAPRSFDALDLRDVTLVGQDWGGLIGLRLATENPDRFAAIVAANTGLPTGDQPMPDIWWAFRRAVESAPNLDIGRLVASGCRRGLTDAARAAYDAPFPDEAYKAGPRAMPLILPTAPDDPATEPNRLAWQRLAQWTKPFLVAFSDGDPITGAMAPVLARTVPVGSRSGATGDRGCRPFPAGGRRGGARRSSVADFILGVSPRTCKTKAMPSAWRRCDTCRRVLAIDAYPSPDDEATTCSECLAPKPAAQAPGTPRRPCTTRRAAASAADGRAAWPRRARPAAGAGPDPVDGRPG